MLQQDSNTTIETPAVAKRQHTLGGSVSIVGKGLLLGEDCSVVIEPADLDTGIVFERSDMDPPVRVPALVDNVAPRARRTTLKSGEATIETVEHCMSALAGLDREELSVTSP